MYFHFLSILALSLSAFAVNHHVKIQSEDVHQLSHLLKSHGYDVAGHHAGKGNLSVVTEDVKALRMFLETLSLKNDVLEIEKTKPAREHFAGIADEENYLSTEPTIEVLWDLARKYPKWAHVVDLTQLLGLPKTKDGRSLYGLQVSLNPIVIEDEPKVLYIGQHHARELMTHHIVLDGAKAILEGASAGDETILKWIESSAIWFVPVVNPDGLAYVFEKDRMWRKNRSVNKDGSFGVDLNRNYEFKWGECGMSSSHGSSDVFKGHSANSEIEVQIMDRLNEKLRVQYLLTFHSYGDEVLYPYLCGKLAEESFYYGLRDELADHLGYQIRHASSSGEDFEHHYAKYGSISFLIEVGQDFQPDFKEYKEEISPTISKSLPFIMNKLHDRFVHFKITDSTTEAPVRAGIRLDTLPFEEGEVREADAFGSYRWVLEPGTYQATFGALGYISKTLSVKASDRTDLVNVQLEPNPLFSGLLRTSLR